MFVCLYVNKHGSFYGVTWGKFESKQMVSSYSSPGRADIGNIDTYLPNGFNQQLLRFIPALGSSPSSEGPNLKAIAFIPPCFILVPARSSQVLVPSQ